MYLPARDKILEFIAQNDAEAVIPAKKNRLVQRDTEANIQTKKTDDYFI